VAAPDNNLISNTPGARISRFGIFQANRHTNELFRQGVRVKVQEQPMQVLLMLLEHPGEIVTREEIRQRLWPVDTFVEFDHSVNTAIKKLRQTLGDDADNPRFIETVPKKGYRFIAPVHDGTAEVPPATTEPEPPSVPHNDRKLQVRAIVIGACLVLALLIGAGWLIRSSEVTKTAALDVIPFTTYSGFEDQASLSPDGNKVAFIWAKPIEKEHIYDGPHVYVKQMGIEQPLQLTKSNDIEFSPAWSPDGNSIAFMRCPANMDPSTRCGVYIASAIGGAERLLTTLDNETDFGTAGMGPAIAWSPAGNVLAYVDRNQDRTASIFLLDLNTLQSRQLTSPKLPLIGDTAPSFSPDGKELAFARNGKEVSDVWVVSVKGGEPERLSNLNQLCSTGIAWTPDGKSLVFGGLALYRVSRKGGVAEPLVNSATYGNPSIRGKRLVFSQYRWDKGIWSIELNASGDAVGKPTQILESTRDQDGPSYSPDGKRLVFGSQRSGFTEIWRADADGNNLLQLTNIHGPLTGTPSYSPDGTTVLFDSRINGNAHLFTVNAEGGPVRQLTSGTTDEVMPSYSHDGRWIYFPSNRTGQWNVWKVPVAGGEQIQVTKQGGFRALESEDGKYVYYAKGTAVPGIWRVPVNGGLEEEVVRDLPLGLNGHWTLYKNKIYYVVSLADINAKSMALHSFDLTTGKSKKIAEIDFPPAFGSPGMTVSPDGKQLLFVAQQNSSADLQIVENFR
jgi:Tol biopolymer transport system component/DNA-binding winged helix-turn-helix (wHTH) protein